MPSYFSSTHNSIVFIQLLTFLISIFGIITYEVFTPYILLSILFFYLYSIFGISMMLHRYYAHKSFILDPIYKWFFTIFAVLAGRGSPLSWAYVHRVHHAYSDTEKDPHSPHFKNFKIIGFKPKQTTKVNYFLVKELMTPIHLKIDKYYLLVIFLFLLLISVIDIKLVFYIWALPVFLVSISQTMFNYFAHKNGYRNFHTKDKSTNNIFLWPFIWGDAWHNNHHFNAGKVSTKIKKYEFDPIVIFINVIRKKNV